MAGDEQDLELLKLLRLRAGAPVDARTRRWAEAFEAWLEERRRTVKHATISDSYRAWREFLAVSGKGPWEVKREDVEAYTGCLEERGLSPSTIGHRLVIDAATPQYYSLNPVEVPDAAPGILLAGPGTGAVRMVININVVNVTVAPVALTLWHDIDDPPSDYFIFGICGGTVPANGYWQWQGELYLEGSYNIFGMAGAANALIAHFGMRAPLRAHR